MKYVIVLVLAMLFFGCVSDPGPGAAPIPPTNRGVIVSGLYHIRILAVNQNMTPIFDIEFKGYNPMEPTEIDTPFIGNQGESEFVVSPNKPYPFIVPTIPDQYERRYEIVRDEPDIKVYKFFLKELKNFTTQMNYINITYSCFDTRTGKFMTQENTYELPDCLQNINDKLFNLREYSDNLECGIGGLKSKTPYEKDFIQNNTLYNIKCLEMNSTVYKSENFTFSTRRW